MKSLHFLQNYLKMTSIGFNTLACALSILSLTLHTPEYLISANFMYKAAELSLFGVGSPVIDIKAAVGKQFLDA